MARFERIRICDFVGVCVALLEEVGGWEGVSFEVSEANARASGFKINI